MLRHRAEIIVRIKTAKEPGRQDFLRIGSLGVAEHIFASITQESRHRLLPGSDTKEAAGRSR